MHLTRRSIAGFAASAPWLNAEAWAQAASPSFADQARRGVEAILGARRVKGAAAALLIDGAPVWMETFGETGGAKSRPIDRDTIFSLQSTSKHITATAVMMAAQRGLVDLDRPLTEYLPDFSVNSRHESEPQRRMTLRLLLSHRAGFTHDAPVGSAWVVDPQPDFAAHMESIQRTWLRFPVGERYAYSNLGIDLAGHVLERVTGLAFPELLRRWIFEPLGMASTTADGDTYVASTNRAIGHVHGFEELPVRLPFVPAGGVYSSIADMAKYAQFHVRRGALGRRRLLERPLWNEMHDFRYGAEYALGVSRRRPLMLERGTIRLLTHNGGGFGFGCALLYCPSEGVAWVVLSNLVMEDDPFNQVMPQPVLEARYGRPRPAPTTQRRPVLLPAEQLHARAGLYMNRDSRCIASVQDGSLVLEFKDRRGANRLSFASEDEAWIADGVMYGEAIRFHSAAALRAPSFTLPAGDHWDFIDGPYVAPGPVGSEYDDRLGRYAIELWGKPVAQVTLSKRNGWLYYEDIRLTPFLPGLFFSGAGEAVDLRGATPTVRNIPLHPIV